MYLLLKETLLGLHRQTYTDRTIGNTYNSNVDHNIQRLWAVQDVVSYCKSKFFLLIVKSILSSISPLATSSRRSLFVQGLSPSLRRSFSASLAQPRKSTQRKTKIATRHISILQMEDGGGEAKRLRDSVLLRIRTAII